MEELLGRSDSRVLEFSYSGELPAAIYVGTATKIVFNPQELGCAIRVIYFCPQGRVTASRRWRTWQRAGWAGVSGRMLYSTAWLALHRRFKTQHS